VWTFEPVPRKSQKSIEIPPKWVKEIKTDQKVTSILCGRAVEVQQAHIYDAHVNLVANNCVKVLKRRYNYVCVTFVVILLENDMHIKS